MKKIIFAGLLILLSSSVLAWTIGPMNYQGRLLDNAGIPVTGSYNFKVRIYDAAVDGTLKFSEQQNSIAVSDGVYSFLVSTGTNSTGAWDIALWNTPQLFLEIEVNNETLSPRHLMAATPYAYQANLALTTNNALALGGKPIEWFDSTLEAICVSGKGKWLELANGGAGACLGAGTKYPGPAMVAVSTLTGNLDFTNLDMTNADLSGIDFGNADFSGSVLKDTTVQPAGIDSINLTGATLEHVLSINSAAVNANFTKAQIKNMNLGYWNLAGATLTGVSAGMLTGCPTGLPAGYRCASKDAGGGNWRSLLVGPGVNLSGDSTMQGRLNPQYTNQATFDDVSLTGIDYSGNELVSITFPPYTSTDMSGSNFKGSSIRNSTLVGNLSGSVFDGAAIKGVEFKYPLFAPVAPTFDGAELNFVVFEAPASNTVFSFSNAILNNVEVHGSAIPGFGQNVSFSATGSHIQMLSTSTPFTSFTITTSVVYGGLMASPYDSLGVITIGGPSGLEGTAFHGGNISGNFTNANFAFSSFNSVSFRGANLFGSSGTYPSSYINVDWYGAICPDGFYVATLGGTCIGHGI